MGKPSYNPPKPVVVSTVLNALIGNYGLPMHSEPRKPLDSLVATILSQNTSDVNSHRAFAALKKAYPSWKKVLEAGEGDLAGTIKAGGLAKQKAPRILAILKRIKEETGMLSLAHLKSMDAVNARDYLLSMPGVGRKTAACVLLFSLKMDVFPVDTHIYRITGRLGWLPEGCNADKAHDVLEELIPAKRYYEGHKNLINHGRTVCKAQKPHCEDCRISKFCAFSN